MFLHNRHCLYGQEGWPGKSKMWYPWSIAWQLVSGADLWLLHLVFHIPFLFAVFVTMWQLLIHILVDAQAKKYDLTQVHLIWITHCIFDIVKEHNISMTFFDKRGVVQIWGSQDSYKALKNVWQCTTYFLPHFWITISSFRMFSNVGKSIVLLCQQTMRPNTRMLSEIEKIIIKDKGKIYNKLKIDPSAYIFVFVLTFLCHKVTHVLFSGWATFLRIWYWSTCHYWCLWWEPQTSRDASRVPAKWHGRRRTYTIWHTSEKSSDGEPPWQKFTWDDSSLHCRNGKLSRLLTRGLLDWQSVRW